jgi:vacuolar protein sorting-associated protein 33A
MLTAVVADFCNTQGPLSTPAVGGHTAEVDTLILLDRTVDLVTPLCTQLTYEGLIDEVLGISNGSVELTSLADQEGALAVRPTVPFAVYCCCVVHL